MDTTPPDWDHCGIGSSADDPGGCRGVRAAGTRCLAHLEPADREAYLVGLRPGADLDCRGVTFDAELIRDLLARLRGDDGRPVCGDALFTQARFTEDTDFSRVRFDGEGVFEGAHFEASVVFDGARFERGGWFVGASFAGAAGFGGVRFAADAGFGSADFRERAWFGGAHFGGRAWFGETVFHGEAEFLRAVFAGGWVGPFVCHGTLGMVEAEFRNALQISVMAARIDARSARFEGAVALRARWATVDLTNAVLLFPSSVATDLSTPRHPGEEALSDVHDIEVSIASIRGVDASMLLLSDVDLTRCRFSGAHHLDQLRFEGKWRLSAAPRGVQWSRGIPRWCTKRQIIEEERQWRTSPRRRRPARHAWGDPPESPDDVPGLATLTTTYRQLRKAREDAKDEPGAADFYYGEMEMRRYSHRPRKAERWLLQAYWLLSGYGLRASRALVGLGLAMAATIVLMVASGLPDTPARPYPASAGVLGKQHPRLQRPFLDRFTGERAEKAADVVIHSVVFRTSGQDLTTAGTYIEMVSRLTEPALLGLAVLAVRGRIKRG
ncbi:pentapeptide repeat-containing protein [Streptomyces ochraceiscleroticus]|uniref:Pentapeptide repeat-containing protein n=1 Tax=Streptomyces ochraceiscleroticus TaxID=47761 RepID=A0ABW1MJG0_9ACTN|nr:pentapeptide repeat-containing protein [Streptomyces ochraceiscleroticus]